MTDSNHIANIETMIAFFDTFDKNAKFEMEKWIHPCGAPSCVAGFTVSHFENDIYRKAAALTQVNLAYTELYREEIITTTQSIEMDDQLAKLIKNILGDDSVNEFFPRRAAELLGLSEEEKDGIFFPSGKYWNFISDQNKPKNAVKALKHLLKDVKARMKDEKLGTNKSKSDIPLALPV